MKLLSANALNLDKAKTVSSGKGLTLNDKILHCSKLKALKFCRQQITAGLNGGIFLP